MASRVHIEVLPEPVGLDPGALLGYALHLGDAIGEAGYRVLDALAYLFLLIEVALEPGDFQPFTPNTELQLVQPRQRRQAHQWGNALQQVFERSRGQV